MRGGSASRRRRPRRARSSASSPTTITEASCAGAGPTRSGRAHRRWRRGRVLGSHAGVANYTIGQRKGLGLATAPAPLRGGPRSGHERRCRVGPVDRPRAACACWRYRGELHRVRSARRRRSRWRPEDPPQPRAGAGHRPHGRGRHGRGRVPGAPARDHPGPVGGLVPRRLRGGRRGHRAPAVAPEPVDSPAAE